MCNPKQAKPSSKELRDLLRNYADGDLNKLTELLDAGADPNVPDEVSRRDMQTKTPNTAP